MGSNYMGTGIELFEKKMGMIKGYPNSITLISVNFVLNWK